MSVFAQIRAQLRLWHELAEQEKTAAEKVIRKDVASLHDGLTGLETKVGLVEVDVLREVRAIVAAAKGEGDALLAKLDAAIKTADDAAVALKAALEAQKKGGTAAPAAAETPAPVAQEQVEPAAPVVDVSQSVSVPVDGPGGVTS